MLTRCCLDFYTAMIQQDDDGAVEYEVPRAVTQRLSACLSKAPAPAEIDKAKSVADAADTGATAAKEEIRRLQAELAKAQKETPLTTVDPWQGELSFCPIE